MAGHAPQDSGIISGINVTPLVDIVLVLLIIFMVTAKVIVSPAVPMDLPKASTSEQVQAIFSVSMAKDGSVFVNGTRSRTDVEITTKAHEMLTSDKDVRAVINADGDVPHRKVIHMLDVIKRAGIARVAFGAQPIHEDH